MKQHNPFEGIPEPIAKALAARGFEKLTPVQNAVLDPTLEGHDVRISSKTGSGKTVALGLLVASLMVEPWESHNPRLLIIAPTRELANQLCTELTWLFANLRIPVTAVTGGTSVYGEKRQLASNNGIVVGTPGRVLDHITSGALKTASLQAVVLDEADQMLDLGFRDELEAIFETLPKERRTHLMSATFSRDIVRLADRYQIKPRFIEATVLGEANKDISHIAHLVHATDRGSAIINMLLLAPDEATLIFTRTRADAADLCSRLTRSGFRAGLLTGDLEQRERTRTLEAFRSGRLKTLVATDVASRGLDIPDVTRVIHGDPPGNAESLTHRSGRTGRAGRKGTSIFLVPPQARMGMLRLFQRARIEVKWVPVPGADDVFRAADERFRKEIEKALETEEADPIVDALAGKLLSKSDSRAVVRVLLSRISHRGPCPPEQVENLTLPSEAPKAQRDRNDRTKRHAPDLHSAGREPLGGFARFRVTWGSRHGANPKRLLALVCRRGNIASSNVGAIDIGEITSTVEVSVDVARDFIRAAREPDARDPKIQISEMTTDESKRFRGPAIPFSRMPDRKALPPWKKKEALPVRSAKEQKRPRPIVHESTGDVAPKRLKKNKATHVTL